MPHSKDVSGTLLGDGVNDALDTMRLATFSGILSGEDYKQYTMLTDVRTAPYSNCLQESKKMVRKGSEEARNQLRDLLDAAEKGRATVITRHGRPVAVLAPFDARNAAVRQESLLSLGGSGRGLWGKDNSRTLRKLRDEWSK